MKPNDKRPRIAAAKKAGRAASGKSHGKGGRKAGGKKRTGLKASEKLNIAVIAAGIILAVTVILLMGVHVYAAYRASPPGGVIQAPEPETEPETEPVVPAQMPPVEKAAPIDPPPQSEPVPVKVPAPDKPPISDKPQAPEKSLPVEQKPMAAPAPERPPERSRGSLVFVIDDAGNNLRDIEPFLKFPGALTIAVLPGLPYSAETARRARAAGKEVFLHQPMEAMGPSNPGPGAIRAGMTREEIRAVIIRNLEEIGPVAGINNHEGSRITADEEAMDSILGLCRERGLVFLDSRTTADTAAPQVARRFGMAIGERDIFIDNSTDRASMLGYINSGLLRAEQRGAVFMIGHASTAALAPLLAELYPDLAKRGFLFASASRIISER